MYKINHIPKCENTQAFIEIEGLQKTSYAKIYLNLGASLQELTLDSHELIKDMYPLTYNNTYASSILFPFANRIKEGRYEVDNVSYQLDINEKDLNNALHGLVYNKTFDVVDQEANDEFGSVTLSYNEVKMVSGFPFTYLIKLEYILSQRGLDLNVEIKNTGSKTFPFTIGWHPYFFSSSLQDSTIDFTSDRKIILDESNITIGESLVEKKGDFVISDKFLDDCYVLKSNELKFNTPKYTFSMKSSEQNSFLQLYTPPHPNTIAIEPTTGVSDSFNNGIGLKVLESNEVYCINWNLKINDK